MNRKYKTAGALMAAITTLAVLASGTYGTFTSEKYPTHITSMSGPITLHLNGLPVYCEENSFTSWLGAAAHTLTVDPSFKKCNYAGLTTTINMTSCDFLFHREPSTMDIACATVNDGIDVVIYYPGPGTPICHIQLPPQTGKTGYTFTSELGKLRLTGTIKGLTATDQRTSVACPAETIEAIYTIHPVGILLSGNNGSIAVD